MKKSQIWIETVIYTLIGLAIIGILLSVVKPAIEEKKDQILIGSSLEMMEVVQDKIEEVISYGVGNSRVIEIKIAKGKLEIKGEEDKIEFSMDSKYMYSEPEKWVMVGNINATTIKKDGKYEVKLVLAYSNLNLTWNNKDARQVFQSSPSPYKITITNVQSTEDSTQVNFY